MSLAAVSIASMAASAVGSLVSGISQAGQARGQAAVAKANAKEAEAQGEAEAGLIRERARRLRGANVAAAGASGVDISSFADALSDSDISAELDAQTAIRNAKVQANNFRAGADAAESSVGPTLIGAGLGAGTQALSGYGNWRLLKSGTNPTNPTGWMGAQMGGAL